MYRISLTEMKLTRPSASSFLASATTRLSWWLSAWIAQHTATSLSPLVWWYIVNVGLMKSDDVKYLPEDGDGVWGKIVVGPHLLHCADGHRDGFDALCSFNKILVPTTVLPLGNQRERQGDRKELFNYLISSRIIFHSFFPQVAFLSLLHIYCKSVISCFANTTVTTGLKNERFNLQKKMILEIWCICLHQ